MVRNNPRSVKIGEKYGRLTVVKYSHSDRFNSKHFECICDCGNIIIAQGSCLKKGDTKSCGCLRKENFAESVRKMLDKKSIKIGDRYGKLTVVEFSHQNDKTHKFYKFKCDCGNMVIKYGNTVKFGNTTSCGCEGKESARKNGKKSRMKHSGEKCHLWKGGISYGPYCPKFSREFKQRVREFFDNKCVECGITEEEHGKKMCVHHVNFDKTSCCDENVEPLFVTLCASCHPKTNFNREYWKEKYTRLINEEYNGQCYLPKDN